MKSKFSSLCQLLSVLMTCLTSPAQVLNLPPRPANALTGSQFSNALLSMSNGTREYWVLYQISIGNVPSWMRTLVPITVTKTISGTPHTVTYYVLPDYLSIGSDNDYFQEPMSPILAQHLANLLNCTLPTRQMVNDIWTNSTVRMTANTFSPTTYAIDTAPVFILENNANRTERNTTTNAHPLGALVSGDKKDLIISSLIYNSLQAQAPKPVVIYGWIQPSGSPIQPAYNGHGETYMDYSHGTRLVQMAVTLDGAPDTVTNILSSTTLNSLLSDEGAIAKPYYTVDSTLTPFVITQPYSQTVKPGSTVQFNVTVTGELPFTYQWKLNGANIFSATNARLTLTNCQSSSAGTYTVAINNSYGTVTSIPAVLKVNTTAFPLLFSDPLSTDTSTNWSLFTATSDFTTNWAYDFSVIAYSWNGSAYFIPPVPDITDGSTRAVRLTVNNTSGVVSGLSLYPKNQVFSNNYALKFDMWVNYPGAAVGAGATGTTEYATSGINHTGSEVNWGATSASSTDGIYFGVDGEGGSSRDYRAYLGNPAGVETDLTGAASGLVAAVHTAAPFPTLFPTTRFETAGAPGKNWVAGELSQSNGVITWKLDGTIVAQRVNSSSFTSGDIMIGYMDIFASIANPAADAYMLYSNVRVEDWSSPPLTSPVITQQPPSLSVLTGSNVVLTANATGSAPQTAKWYFNGSNIPGATNFTLSLPAIQTTNAGNYAIVFSNSVGSVASSTAQISTTVRPFQFTAATPQVNGSLQLTFTGAIGSQYTVQASSNLVNWDTIGALGITANPAIFLDTNALSFTNRFYRLVTSK